MKKLISIALCFLLAGCTAGSGSVSDENSEDRRSSTGFANPVELTSKELDMDGYQYLEDTDPAFIQVTLTESLRLFDEGGTGVILYSYDTCPYCNRAVPVLNEAAKEMDVKVYYVDIYESELEDLPAEERDQTIQKLYDHLPYLPWEMNEDTGKYGPAFYVPEVVSVKEGEVMGHHTSLTDDFTLMDADTQLSEEQHAELKQIYEELITIARVNLTND